MGLISSILTLTWITETSLGFIGNRVDESLASKLNLIKKRVKEYLSDTEIPLNNDLQKAVECSHWLATKVFCEELKKRSYPPDILNRIFEVANLQINLIKNKNYLQNLDVNSFDIESIILGNEQNVNDLLKRKIIDFHIKDLSHLLNERERNHASFESVEQNIRNGLDNLDWFSLACSFLNDSLTGDNNKAKDAFHNYYLAKISKNGEENQRLLMSITSTMNGFVDSIGKERFEEFKLLVDAKLHEISDSLNKLNESVDKVSQLSEEILKSVGDNNGLKNERFLTGLPINLNFELIGRENDLNRLIQLLEYQDRVLIYGMRGLGKTTLSKFVLRRLLLDNKIDYVAWLSTGNDLQEAFLKDIGEVHLSKQVSNAVNFGSSSIEIIERIIIPYLTNLEGKFKLIVIDNLTTEQFPIFRRISEKLFNWKILTTSFQKLSNQRDDFELNLLSISDAIRLFYSNYNRIIDESAVEQLVSMVGYHTLTIEILAKTAESLDLTPQALLKRFEEKGLNLSQYNLDIEINHNNGLIEGLLPYYKVIFDISALSILEQDLLVKLSIFPSLPFNKSLIIPLIIESQESDAIILGLKNLERRGWIALRDEAYQMHQVIQLVIQQRDNFSIEKCRKLINTISALIEKEFQINPQGISNIILIAENIQATFRLEKDKSLYDLNFVLALFYFNVGDYEKAKNIYIKLSGEYDVNDMDLTLIYNNLGLIYEKQAQFPDSYKYFIKSLNLREAFFGVSHEEVSTAYNSLGNFFSGQNDLGQAMSCLQEAHKILLNIYGDLHPKLSGVYNNIGEVFRKMGDENSVNKARFYYLKSLSTLEKGEIGLEAANVYNNLGIISEGEVKKDYYEKALNIRRKLYGESHPIVAESCGNLGIYYRTQKDFLEAVKHCEKSLSINWEIYGEIHPAIGVSYLQLGSIYDEMEQFDKALQNYFNASTIIPHFFSPNHPMHMEYSNKIIGIHLNPKAITFFEEKIKDENLNEDEKSWSIFILDIMYKEQKKSK